MQKVYSSDCMSRTQVFTWYARFKDGRNDLNDDPRTGRPVTATSDEIIEKVREAIALDSNVTCMAEEFNVAAKTIYDILTVNLNKRKMCAHKLTEDQEMAIFWPKNKCVCVIQHPPYALDFI